MSFYPAVLGLPYELGFWGPVVLVIYLIIKCNIKR